MKSILSILVSFSFLTTAFADVHTETVSVAMRDGTKLATDVYRDDEVQQAPVVLMRTPYDRTKQKGLGERWAKAGYIFVAQDCRGTRESEGVIERAVIGNTVQVKRFLCSSDADFNDEIFGADALIVWHNTPITAAGLSRLRNCKVLVRKAALFCQDE